MSKIYAVIDTNVVVSALIAKSENSPPLRVLREALDGSIIPLYHKDILAEYFEVLKRSKFNLSLDVLETVIKSIITSGVEIFPTPSGEIFVDKDDLIFYEVALQKRDDGAYLVTGNQKHYPIKDFIVTPSEMVAILDKLEKE